MPNQPDRPRRLWGFVFLILLLFQSGVGILHQWIYFPPVDASTAFISVLSDESSPLQHSDDCLICQITGQSNRQGLASLEGIDTLPLASYHAIPIAFSPINISSPFSLSFPRAPPLS